MWRVRIATTKLCSSIDANSSRTHPVFNKKLENPFQAINMTSQKIVKRAEINIIDKIIKIYKFDKFEKIHEIDQYSYLYLHIS